MEEEWEQRKAEQDKRWQQMQAERAQRRGRGQYPLSGHDYQPPGREAMEKEWEQMHQERGAPYGYQGRRGYGYGGYPAHGPAYGYGGYPAAPSSPYGYGRGWDYPGYQVPAAPAAAPEAEGQAGGGQSQ